MTPEEESILAATSTKSPGVEINCDEPNDKKQAGEELCQSGGYVEGRT